MNKHEKKTCVWYLADTKRRLKIVTFKCDLDHKPNSWPMPVEQRLSALNIWAEFH